MSRSIVLGVALSLLSSVSMAQTPAAPAPAAAAASTENPLANRPQILPVLRFLQAKGVKLTALGNEGGMPTYLGESPNGRMQVFYVTPDGNHIVAGILFDVEGNNITGVQLGEMQRRFEAAQQKLGTASATETVPGTVVAPAAVPAPVAPAAQPAPPKPAAAAPAAAPNRQMPSVSDLLLPPRAEAPVTSAVTSPALASRLSPNAPVVAPAPAPQAEPVPVVPEAPKVPAAVPAVPERQTSLPVSPLGVPAAAVGIADAGKFLSPLDRGAVERGLRGSGWFSVGLKTAPAMYMVVDPQCPYCHAAWGRLREAVLNGKVQLRVIMIAGLKGSMPLAISILSRENPGQAWFEGEGSTDGVTIQPPPAQDSRGYQDAQQFLKVNSDFVREFGITQTPTLLYFGKDERLYSAIGLPEDAEKFMAAL